MCSLDENAGTAEVIMDIRGLECYLGADIGGTLAKLVLAARREHPLPAHFGEAGRTHNDLVLHLRKKSEKCIWDGADDAETLLTLQFLSGPTHLLERIVQHLSAAEHKIVDPERVLYTAGGGAHKLGARLSEVFNLRIVPIPEMESIVKGLVLLHTLKPPGELYTVRDNTNQEVRWPEPLFPFLLVNMGSGVSVLRVDWNQSQVCFERVGGTACGGATFLGLSKLLTSARTFEEALDLARRGNREAVDKTVADIYGQSGSKDLGLPGNLTAASFGKLGGSMFADKDEYPSEEDVASSLLTLVTQAATVLAKAYATQLGVADGMKRVFFAGGFPTGNPQAREAIADSLRNLGGQAHFLAHSDFLGAIGSLSCNECLEPAQCWEVDIETHSAEVCRLGEGSDEASG